MSDLHRQNLEEFRRQRGLSSPSAALSSTMASQAAAAEQLVYRDRAKERRLKYGEDDQMQVRANKMKVRIFRQMAYWYINVKGFFIHCNFFL